MADNITVRQDPAGNIRPNKAKSTEKTDGIVATIMALDRAIRNGGDETSESVYDECGLLFI
ncbi:MAG: terminase [Arcanobacterium sp.]|nr:terminase [Arcanobacterium sp.]